MISRELVDYDPAEPCDHCGIAMRLHEVGEDQLALCAGLREEYSDEHDVLPEPNGWPPTYK